MLLKLKVVPLQATFSNVHTDVVHTDALLFSWVSMSVAFSHSSSDVVHQSAVVLLAEQAPLPQQWAIILLLSCNSAVA